MKDGKKKRTKKEIWKWNKDDSLLFPGGKPQNMRESHFHQELYDNIKKEGRDYLLPEEYPSFLKKWINEGTIDSNEKVPAEVLFVADPSSSWESLPSETKKRVEEIARQIQEQLRKKQ